MYRILGVAAPGVILGSRISGEKFRWKTPEVLVHADKFEDIRKVRPIGRRHVPKRIGW